MRVGSPIPETQSRTKVKEVPSRSAKVKEEVDSQTTSRPAVDLTAIDQYRNKGNDG